MKKLLIFDTETNGLPITFLAKMNDTRNWPRITQLGWELCWEDGTTIQKMCEIIKPDNWVVPNTEFFITQGISTEKCMEEGVALPVMLEYFIEDLEQADLMIAHNMSFDRAVINCEMFRYRMYPSSKTEKYCTKMASTSICKIPGMSLYKYKWPSLEEAYTHFFGPMPEGAHRADFDVEACKKIYLEIQKYNLMKDMEGLI